jgi:hypothetical protein
MVGSRTQHNLTPADGNGEVEKMTIADVAPALVLVFGLVALATPETLARQTGLVAPAALGRSELRAVFGGVFVGVAVVCLATRHPAAYLAAAATFLGGAAAKLLSAALERGVLPAALPGLLFDLAAGGLLVWAASTLP